MKRLEEKINPKMTQDEQAKSKVATFILAVIS
jgi:hypothetical protein